MDREALQERFGIIGTSAAIQHAIDRLRLVSRTEINVLVQGESGVGKELFANAIHELSPRKHGPLVVVNCGAIPEGLIESELFGAEKGAYTGSVERRTGYFEEADGGTIFLDEVGELPLAAQVRLLRVLETGQYTRVGSSTTKRTDARVVAATNRDLAREVEARRFREDLFYRLSTVVLNIPPLRDRREDVLPIFSTFLHRFAQKYNSPGKRLDESARQFLTRYDWPGNVRELRNVAEQCIVLHRGDTLTADDMRPFLRGVGSPSGNLVPVSRHETGDGVDGRELGLIYRALLELRHEMRDLKDQIGALVSGAGFHARREAEPARAPESGGSYVILRDADGKAYEDDFEDVVPYEIEGEDASFTEEGEREPSSAGEKGADNGLPTLEQAERNLIAEALRRFDGNRRQTARTLGISERTLYRKLKEYDLEG